MKGYGSPRGCASLVPPLDQSMIKHVTIGIQYNFLEACTWIFMSVTHPDEDSHFSFTISTAPMIIFMPLLSSWFYFWLIKVCIKPQFTSLLSKKPSQRNHCSEIVYAAVEQFQFSKIKMETILQLTFSFILFTVSSWISF